MSWWNFWRRLKQYDKKPPPAPEPPPEPKHEPPPEPKHEPPKQRLCCTYLEGVVACAKCGDKAAFCGHKGDIYRQVELRRAPNKEVETRTDFWAGHGCEMCGAFAHEKFGAPPQYGLDPAQGDVPCAAARGCVCPHCEQENVIPCANFCDKNGISPECFKCRRPLIGENAVVHADENLLAALEEMKKAVRQDLATRGELRNKMFDSGQLED
jgi:hypothetical protein